MTRAAALFALLLFIPATSDAQNRDNQITIRGFGDAGVTVFTATQSFKAVLGKPSGPVFGGGVELGLPRRLFVSVAATRFKRTGHRVFVFEGQVFPLNVPATITVTPLELTGGYRFVDSGHLVPYAGGGVGWHKYQETSAHSTAAEDVKKTFTGYHVVGGAEIPMASWLAAAAEAQWAAVPNALGNDPNGVSSTYNEHDLGGFTFRVKVVVGR
jgi:opacity protein-like surface antigen